MDISNTQLWDEIEEIIEDGERSVHYIYGAAFIFEEESTRPLSVVEISVERDYRNKYNDVMYVRLLIGESLQDTLLYNEREGLLLCLWRKRVGEVNAEVDDEDKADEEAPEDIEHFFYRAALKENKLRLLEGHTTFGDKADDADLMNQIVVDVQCYSLAVEELRDMYVGGIFKDSTPADVLKGLTTHGLSLTENSMEPIIKGVDMVDPDNEEEWERVIVPPDITLSGIARYIQEKQGGVYDYGIGSYIQDEHWYIWPLYNLRRYDDVEKTLTVINIPEGRLPGIERSYYVKDGAVVLISTGRVKHIDPTQSARMNLGKGFRYPKADRVIGSFAETSPDGSTWKIEVDRDENAAEIVYDPSTDVHQSLGSPHPTRTKYNLITPSPLGASSNPHYHKSLIAERNGSLLAVSWEKSRPDLIYPGMPVKYVFLVDEMPYSLEGVVIGHNFTTAIESSGVSDRRHFTVSDLLLFIQSPDYMEELEPAILEPDEDDPPIPNVGS